jgi:hypothetical protein
MPLNRIERITALSLFAKQEYATLGRLVEETNNLNKDQKIDVLSSLVQLFATEATRIQYSDDTKHMIEDVVSVLGEEDRSESASKLAVVEG